MLDPSDGELQKQPEAGDTGQHLIGGQKEWVGGLKRAGPGGGVKSRLMKTENTEAKFSQWLSWGAANPLCSRIIWPSD